MKLYEIDHAIMECVDNETGEIVDFDKLNALTMAREKKLEGVGIAIKNLTAEAKAIREEEKTLAERRKVLERKAESYKEWLANVLNGDKFETSKIKCSFRKSSRINVNEERFGAWAISHDREELLIFTVPKPNKTKLKEVILSGEEIPGVAIEETNSLSVK
jgi:hypothetical protein